MFMTLWWHGIIEEIVYLKWILAREFEIKDLCFLEYFLGIEVARCSNGIFLSQKNYVLDLLTETGMLGCNPIDCPIEVNYHFVSSSWPTIDRERYQRLVDD